MVLHRTAVMAVGICIATTLGGCGTLSEGIQSSAAGAAQDPWTWGPMAGAALVAGTQTDRRISNWARRQTPLFGSTQDAEEAGNTFGKASSDTAWLIFAFARKRGDGVWLKEKAIDAVANTLGVATAREVTLTVKGLTKRERPGFETHDSFPSGRASDAFAHAEFGRYYAERLSLEPYARETAKWAVSAFAATAAWARVEAGGHYPTDVLVGAAVGNFTTHFFRELFAPNGVTGWRIAGISASRGLLVTFSRPL